MLDDPHDITNNVFHPRNDPWDAFDRVMTFLRDGFAAVGVFCMVLFLIGWAQR